MTKDDDVPAVVSSHSERLARSTAGNTMLVLGGRMAARFLALFTIVLVGNGLGRAGYGSFSTVVTYVSLISVIVDLGFNTLFQREGAREPDQLSRYLRNVMSTRLIFAVPAGMALAVALLIPRAEELFVAAFALLLSSALVNILRSTFFATGRLVYEAVDVVLEAAVLLGLAYFGMATRQGPAYYLWAYTISYVVSSAFFAAVIQWRRMARLGWEFDLEFLREWLPRSLPFALTFIVTTIYFKIDLPILEAIRGPEQAGVYAYAYKPFEALLFVPITLLNVAFPVMGVLHRESVDAFMSAISRFYRWLFLLGWPLGVGIMVMGSGLISLLDSRHQFVASGPVLQVLGLGVVLTFVANAYIAALNSSDHQSLFTRAAAGTLVVNVVLNLALIPRFGYMAAAWSTVLTELSLIALSAFFLRRVLGSIPVVRLSWRPALAGLAMGASLLPAAGWRGPPVVIAILVGVVIYGLAGLLLGAFSRADLRLLTGSRSVRAGTV